MLGATPGLAVGYFLLLAYILNRVRPLPITFVPEVARRPSSESPDRGARTAWTPSLAVSRGPILLRWALLTPLLPPPPAR